MLILKPDKNTTKRELQTIISQELRFKNPQESISKWNPIMNKQNYTPLPSGISSRYARLAQHLKINQVLHHTNRLRLKII